MYNVIIIMEKLLILLILGKVWICCLLPLGGANCTFEPSMDCLFLGVK